MKSLLFIAMVVFPLLGAGHAQDNIKSGPELIWKYRTDAPVFSSPVIQNNILFAGSTDSAFYALDLLTGKKLWAFKTGGEIRSAATVDTNIYFVSSDGNLYCLNETGKLIWFFKTDGEKKYDFADYYYSSPILFNSVLYSGSGSGYIYAVNSVNGEMKWKYKTNNAVHSTPLVDSTGLYAGSFDGCVYALNINDGSLKWKFKTAGHMYFPAGEVQGNPVSYKNSVFIGARDYNYYAIDKEKGYCRWNKVFTKGWVLANTVKDNELFIAGADERILACIDPESGKVKWIRDMEFLMFGNPALYNSRLYIGTTIGKLHCIDASSGKDLWIFSTDYYKQNRFKYFKEDDSYRDDIYSIIKSNEQFLDVEIELGGFFSTPAIGNGYLAVSCTDGFLYCFKLNDKQ
jgi:eukaryotic-like serine/threonine-protein kinase